MIKKSYKNITAALASYVSVAVILFFFTACGDGKSKFIALDSIEDTLAYSMGSIQKIRYMHYIETSCNVDSAYRTICFEGIEKGYNDKVLTPVYYDGISIGIQTMFGFTQIDKRFSDKQFVDGLIDGAFNKEQVAKIDTSNVSFTYKKGLVNSLMLTEYVKEQKYTSTEIDKFIEGFKEGTSAFGNPEKYAFVCGKVFGKLHLRRAFNSINYQVYGADSTKYVSPEIFYAGFIECNLPDAPILHSKAKDLAMYADYKLKDSLYADNRAKGEEFLKENEKKPGIHILPSGIQYKIIKKGSGKIPTEDNQVGIHYIGKTIDGNVFTDSHKYKTAVPMNIKSADECYREILKIMPVGSVYEIYVPQQLAFGTMQTDYLKPFSAVIYEIELINIIK